MKTEWLGEIGYREALALQHDLVDRRLEREIPDTLLLLTHPHVYTLGRRGDEKNLLVPRESLAAEGIPLERVERGGDITYHGPGQLVGYPIFRLGRPGVRRFVSSIEEALIDALSGFGVRACAVPGLTGVWVGEKKIASIGIAVRKWVTYHGFALNVTTDLSRFRRIHLCGLKGREATSIAEATGSVPSMDAVRDAVASACARRLEWVSS